MKTQLTLGEITLHLHRYPINSNEQHQAWDAGDEYLIEHIEQLSLTENSHILILNDHFGALCTYACQKGLKVTSVNDSLVSKQSIEQNVKANNALQNSSITYLSSLDQLPNDIDLALMKLPKSNRLLVWQLSQLACTTKQDLSLIATAKAKDIHSSTLKLFENHLGIVKTSLAQKKARLIFCQKTYQLTELPNPITRFCVAEYELNLANYANVFACEKLDVAAHLMLQHIPQSDDFKHIIDLGCGNGVLAIAAARKNMQAKITAVDESYMAVASAKINLIEHGINPERIDCVVNNSLDGFVAKSADLILCNPPFHQQNTITDHIAWKMFCDAKRVLATNGRLVVIGNRHLGYHAKMKRLFGNARTIASNAKFAIIEAIQ